MPPTRPTLVKPDDAPATPTWDAYVTEATANIVPFVQPLPPLEDGTDGGSVEVPCPTGDQIDALGVAQRSGSDEGAFVAIFGPDVAPRLLLATKGLPFFVRAKLVGDVMRHYGMQASALGD